LIYFRKLFYFYILSVRVIFFPRHYSLNVINFSFYWYFIVFYFIFEEYKLFYLYLKCFINCSYPTYFLFGYHYKILTFKSMLTFKFVNCNTFNSLPLNNKFDLLKLFMFSFVIIILFPSFVKFGKLFLHIFVFTFYFRLSFLSFSFLILSFF